MKVEISDQVLHFVASQAPDSRKLLRRALRDLAGENGNIRTLEGALEGFLRLRAGSFRIIFRYVTASKKRVIRCEFAERRSIVYEVFEKIIAELRGADGPK